MSFCNNENDHRREGRDDYERRGRYDHEMYHDRWNDCSRHYCETKDLEEEIVKALNKF